MKEHKAIKIISRILLIIPLALSGIFVLLFGSLNAMKYVYYNSYYRVRQELCLNPGLNDGFIPQGITYDEENDCILTSGYMNDKSASRIYVTDFNNNSHYVELTRDDKKFTGHIGGIASTGDTLYIANGSKVHVIDINYISNSSPKRKVDIGDGYDVNNAASFIFCDDTDVYVGEFHNGKEYQTDHPYKTKEGMHYAIITAYAKDDLTKPLRVYSIRDKVQGFCILNNYMILSTSYGLADSVFYAYNKNEITKSEYTLDGAPVYFLEDYYGYIKAPAMMEDLDVYDDRVITLTESACDKYIFGKFFFSDKIVALDIG